MRLFNYFKKQAKQDQVTTVSNLLNRLMVSKSMAIYMPDNAESFVQKAYAANLNVYSIISKIGRKCTGVKPILKERLKSGESVVIKQHEALDSINKPNANQSFYELMFLHIIYKKSTGNSYWYYTTPDMGPNMGKPIELYQMPAQYTEIRIDKDAVNPIYGYSLTAIPQDIIPQKQVCHIKEPNPNWGLNGEQFYGLSPIKAGLKSIQSNNDAFDALVKMYQNLGPGGMLSGDGASLTNEQAMAVKEQIKEKQAQRLKDILVSSANLKFVQFGLDAVDLSIIEAQNLNLRDICNLYNVPSQLMNDTSASTYNNMTEAKIAFILDCIVPELDLFFEQFSPWYLQYWREKENRDLYFDYDPMVFDELRQKQLLQVETLSKAYWLTGNQKLIAMGYDKNDHPYMNEVLVPNNIKRLDDIEITLPNNGNSNQSGQA